MYKYFIVFIGFTILSSAQNIVFTDVNFKNALVNTNCINIDSSPGADIDADINNSPLSNGENKINNMFSGSKAIPMERSEAAGAQSIRISADNTMRFNVAS